MSDIQHDWVKEQVGDLQNKSPDNKDAWIGNALKGKKGIVNAQDVFVIQSALKALGHDPGKVDGVYKEKGKNTSNTITAVRDFQTKNGLTVDGQVGPETIAKLIEKLGIPVKPEAPAPVKPEAPAPVKPEAPAPVKPEAPAILDRSTFLEKNKVLLTSAGMSLQSEIKVDETDNDKYQLLQLDHSKNQFTLKSSDGRTQEVDSGNLRIWTNQNLRIEASSDGSFILSTLNADGKTISTITSKQKMADGNTLQQQVQGASGASSKGLSFSK